MRIQDCLDFSLLKSMLENWAIATGMGAIVIDDEGEFLTHEIGCPAGSADELSDFAVDLVVSGNCVGRIVAGHFDEDMPKSEESIAAAEALLNGMVDMMLNGGGKSSGSLSDNIAQAVDLIDEINAKSVALDKIESKQKILSLNASIEAARAGEFGRGFAVVATEFGKLAVDSGEINKSIKASLKSLTTAIDKLEKSTEM